MFCVLHVQSFDLFSFYFSSLLFLDDYAFNLKKSLETPLIQSDFFDVLQISSITRGVKISSGNTLNVTSNFGDVSIYSLKDLTLKSTTGKVSTRFNIKPILMMN